MQHYRAIPEHYRVIVWEFENSIIGKNFSIIYKSLQLTLSITRAACDFKGGLGACSPWKIFEFRPSEMASGKF